MNAGEAEDRQMGVSLEDMTEGHWSTGEFEEKGECGKAKILSKVKVCAFLPKVATASA